MIRHELDTMVRQWVYGVVGGYEDLNDHEMLCFDKALQAATGGNLHNRNYDHHCYFPLYVLCGRHLLVSYLRTSNRGDTRHSWAILALLVRFIRQYWPDTRIVFLGGITSKIPLMNMLSNLPALFLASYSLSPRTASIATNVLFLKGSPAWKTSGVNFPGGL